MQDKKSIAVFGGAFNPPLISHYNFAKEILEKYANIYKIIFVPVSTKYDKADLVTDEHRYNMLKLLCEKDYNIEISKTEINSTRQLYTLETLDLIQKENINDDIIFILGTDNLKQFPSWYKPEQILKKHKLLVLKRNNEDIKEIINSNKLLHKYKGSIIYGEGIEQINLSSTYARECIKKGKDVSNIVPKKVLEYINKNHLYK